MKIYEWMDDILEIMWGNAMEASKYIKEAHESKEECRGYADWCRDMAMKHMEFNDTGKNLFERMKGMLSNDHDHKEHSTVIMMIYERQMAKLQKTCAEIRAMMEMYK